MSSFEPFFVGVIGILYLAILAGIVAAVVIVIQTLRRMALAQEETARMLRSIAHRMDEAGDLPA